MTATVSDILTTISDALPMRSRPRQEMAVNPPQAFLQVGEDGLHYDESFDGSFNLDVNILVLIAKGSERTAQESAYTYMDLTGDNSIPAAIDAAMVLDEPLQRLVSDVTVTAAHQPNVYAVGGQEYFGVEFDLTVLS